MQVLKPNKNIIHFIEAGKAFQLANQKQLPVLVEFCAPGCKKMEINPEIQIWGQRA